MKKILAVILSLVAILGLVGCETNNSTSSKNNSNSNPENVSLETLDMSEYDIIYDFNAIPEKFWDGYEYGWADIEYMNNEWVLNTALEKELGLQFGKLNPPKVEYTQYTMIDGVAYKIVINKGSWFYPEELIPIGTGNYSNSMNFWYVTTDLQLHRFLLELEEDIYTGSKDSEGYIDTINGWDVISDCMYQKLNDEFYLKITPYRIANISNEQYKTYYTAIANSFTLKGVEEGINFEQIVLPDEYSSIKLGDKVTVNLKDYYVSSWLVGEFQHREYNILRFTDKNKTGIYGLVEYPENVTIDDFKEQNKDYSYFEEYNWKGLNIQLWYSLGTSLGETEFASRGELIGFIFEQDGLVYTVEYLSKEDIKTDIQIENFLENIEFLAVR